MTVSFVVHIVLQYVLLPLVLLALATPWLLRAAGPPSLGARVVWGLIAAFSAIYGSMGSLRYLAYRTPFHDLGAYDQRIWSLSRLDPLSAVTRFVEMFGHFSPILTPHAMVYRIYPSALVLIWLQVIAVALGAYAVYRLAERHLGTRPALAFAAAYLLYPSVVFTVLHDFHPDHLAIPLLLFAFDALDRGLLRRALLLTLLLLLVKETMAPTAMAFGLYALFVTGRRRLGLALLAGGLAAFALVIVPMYGGVFRREIGAMSYGYLGSTISEILRTIVLSPGTWLAEATKLPKLQFLYLMLAPVALLSLLAPSALLVAVPGLALSMLSQWSPRHQIWTQYVNPIVPPVFVAAILGYARLLEARLWPRLAAGMAGRDRLLAGWLLVAAVYFNVLLSPSPISTTFWLGWVGLPAQTRWPAGALAPVRTGEWLSYSEWVRWPLHWTAYVVGERERRIREALRRHVPATAEISVSAQNNLNSSHLAHRRQYTMFPGGGDYIVVDTRRPSWVYAGIDADAYAAALAAVRRARPLVHAEDGLLIFGPRSRPLGLSSDAE
jgi:uncharacterized membrane protein